jgi:hypothetical protein
LLWLELLKALDQCLPTDDPANRPDDIMDRNEIHVKSLDCEWFPNLSTWYASGVSEKIKQLKDPAASGGAPADGAPEAPLADSPPAAAAPPPIVAAPAPGRTFGHRARNLPAAPAPEAAPVAVAVAPGEDPGPTGAGWVIELRCHHFHNKDPDSSSFSYVRDTLIKDLREKKVNIPGKDGQVSEVLVKDLGIGYPVIVSEIGKLVDDVDPTPVEPKKKPLKRFDFTLQFSWQPTPLGKRIEIQNNRKAPQNPALAADNQPAGGS